MREKWRDLGAKDRIQYAMAVLLILSGIGLAVASFATMSDVANGTLIYISEAFITAGGIFGVSIYFKDKLNESRNGLLNAVRQMLEDAITRKLPDDSPVVPLHGHTDDGKEKDTDTK